MIVLCRLFLLVLCVFTLNAVGIDFAWADTEMDESTCKTTNGYYWKASSDSFETSSCNKCPDRENVELGSNGLRDSITTCYIVEKIPLGTKTTYATDSGVYDGTSNFTCDTNAIVNSENTDCVCKDGYKYDPDDGDETTCEPIIKKINLNKNCGIWAWKDICIGTTSDLTLYLKYTGTWHSSAYDETSVDLGDLINKQVNTRKQFKLTGIIKAKTSQTRQR